MISLNAWTVDCPERSARSLLDRFAGDLATVERYIVDEELAAALREDDYDSYLHWRRIKSICAELAAERRLAGALARRAGKPSTGADAASHGEVLVPAA
jgi:hypothetical protein